MTTLAPIHTIKMNAEQYFQLGEDPSGTHLELIDGELIVSPSPNRTHAEIIVALVFLLEGRIRQQKSGRIYLDTDVIFTSETVRRPDIAYFGQAKLKQMVGQRLILAPDLAVEILSPSNPEDDRINKFHLYQSHGVGHYWIFDPVAQTAECFEFRNGCYELAASGKDFDTLSFPPFPDLSIPLKEIWLPPT